MNPKLTISHLKMGDYHSFLAIYSFQNAEIRTLLGGEKFQPWSRKTEIYSETIDKHSFG